MQNQSHSHYLKSVVIMLSLWPGLMKPHPLPQTLKEYQFYKVWEENMHWILSQLPRLSQKT